MAAVLKLFRDSGAATGSPAVGTTRATVDSADAGPPVIPFGRSEDGTTVIPAPSSTGTHFSWPIWVYLWCSSGGGSTHISAKTLELATSIATGVHEWFVNVATATGYTQPAADEAADSGSNDATPGSATEVTSASPVSWDTSSVAATNSAVASSYARLSIGIDALFASGGGTLSLPNITAAYTEGP